MTDVRGKRVLIVGLARTGRAAAHCLQRRGAVVTVTDSRPPWALHADVRELLAHRIGLELGLHRAETFQRQDLIVISPGVLPNLPELEAARQKNVLIVPEVEVASWFLEGELVGITGSNGKTTTTALLGKILEASGFRTFVGGNIGVPLISAVDKVSPDTLVVAELSSFQLETIRDFRPRVAVLLNLSGNHLDRHPTFEAYVRAKAQIFRNQTPDDFAVLNADDPAVLNLASSIAARKIYFSRSRSLPQGMFVSDGRIIYRVGNLERVLMQTREVALRGEFNLENVLAAAGAACALGADFEALRWAVREFRAVEHRLEQVGEIRGVQFYNDSKATSVDAVVKALSAFDRGVHLILGGKDKGAPYAPLRPLLRQRVRKAYLIGAAAERIARELKGWTELVHCGDLETAIRQAFEQAVPGDTILLSPACASFDQFQDYEHRGRVFKQVVERLSQEVAAAGPARAEVVAELSAVPIPQAVVAEIQPQVGPEVPQSPPPASTASATTSPRPQAAEPLEAAPSSDTAPEVGSLATEGLEEQTAPTSEISSEPDLQAFGAGDRKGAASCEIAELTPATKEPVDAVFTEAPPGEPGAVEVGAAAELPEAEEVKESPHGPEAVSPPVAQAHTPPGEVSYPELLFVYEVGAEEVACAETQVPPILQEEHLLPPIPEELWPSESVSDERLPFEVRVTTGAAPRRPGTPEPPAGQGRLPGI